MRVHSTGDERERSCTSGNNNEKLQKILLFIYAQQITLEQQTHTSHTQPRTHTEKLSIILYLIDVS